MNALLVQIVNDPSQPVPVRDVDRAAQQPFQNTVEIPYGQGDKFAVGSFEVPIDKRLVIEYVSVGGTGLFGPTFFPMSFSMTTKVGVDFNHHGLFTLRPEDLVGGNDAAVTGRMVRIYADPGTRVDVSCTLNDTNPGPVSRSVNVVISGHLVDP
jgi:hypothetical protein